MMDMFFINKVCSYKDVSVLTFPLPHHKVVPGFSEYHYNSDVIRKFYNNDRLNRKKDDIRGNLRIQMS